MDGMLCHLLHPSIVDAIFAEQCVQLGTDYLVAHYDVKSSEEPIYQTSGNVLTVHDNYVHLSVGEAGSCLSCPLRFSFVSHQKSSPL